MARIRTEGIDAITQKLKELGELQSEVVDEMLFAAAEEMKQAWRAAAKKHGLEQTGKMIETIGFEKRTKGGKTGRTLSVYPQGSTKVTVGPNGKTYKRPKSVRTAEIAFINHYGTSSRPGTFFVDEAEDNGTEPALAAMERVWDKFLKERGF